MKNYLFFLIITLSLFSCTKKGKLKYPETLKKEVTDNYFGTPVKDPYRWLEDDNSEATKRWVQAENEVTFKYLSNIPFRDSLRVRLNGLINHPKYEAPIKKNGKFYFFKNDGLQNQSVLYSQESLEAKAELLLDPNTLSNDGTVALTNISFSNDGKYLAYSIARNGSDWNEIYVLDLQTKELLSDHIEWVKFSAISWYKEGFFYSAYQAPEKNKAYSDKNENQRVYYHTLGQKQTYDHLMYQDANAPLRNFKTAVSDDERFLFLSCSESSSGNSLWFARLRSLITRFRPLVNNFNNNYSVVGCFDDKAYILTDWNAPKYRLLEVDLYDYIMFPFDYSQEKWKEIIPEKQTVLQSVSIVGNKILASYMKDVSIRSFAFDFSGKELYEIKLPPLGTLSAFSGNKNENEAFYSFSSFTIPPTVFRFNTTTNTSTVFKKPEIIYNEEEFVSEQVFYSSKDSTKVPMFLVYKKGLKKTGDNPTLLYGYGGFNISLNPKFKTEIIPFLENGGIYAVPNLRGGGEYGEKWHKAGTKLEKQNVFNDFIAAAEYLIDQGYTKSSKLAINGGSNGGLLVGACLTQRPDLFAVAVPEVGVLDMLRYHKFTIGWAWVGDYGSSEDSKEMFEYLKAYSPVHNIFPGIEYPALLVTTGDHDDRVVPAHSFKFVATMQNTSSGKKPALIRVDSNAGHGAGKPISKIIDTQTDIYSFIMYNLEMNTKFK